MKKAILYLIVFAVIEITVGLAVSLIASPQMSQWTGIGQLAHVDPANVTLTASGIIAVALIALFTLTKWYPTSRQYIRTRPWPEMFWSFLLALGIIIPLTWIEEFIPAEYRVNVMKDDLAAMLHSTTGYFIIAMLMPLAEEIVFRGAMISALRTAFLKSINKDTDGTTGTSAAAVSGTSDATAPAASPIAKQQKFATVLAVVIAALFFSGAHMNPAQMPHAFVVGCLLGWLYLRTGSIVLPFIIHWVNNSAAYATAAFFPNIPVDAPLVAYFNGSHTAVLQAVLSSLLVALPALYQLHRLTGRR